MSVEVQKWGEIGYGVYKKKREIGGRGVYYESKTNEWGKHEPPAVSVDATGWLASTVILCIQ